MNEFKIEGYDYEFRIKKMNAIETLAIKTQANFNTYEDSMKFFKVILEHCEVKMNNSWVTVKTPGMEVYYPAIIEEDVDLVEKIAKKFLEIYIKPVFPKSSESQE